mgnify:CR=1 FL=1
MGGLVISIFFEWFLFDGRALLLFISKAYASLRAMVAYILCDNLYSALHEKGFGVEHNRKISWKFWWNELETYNEINNW